EGSIAAQRLVTSGSLRGSGRLRLAPLRAGVEVSQLHVAQLMREGGLQLGRLQVAQRARSNGQPELVRRGRADRHGESPYLDDAHADRTLLLALADTRGGDQGRQRLIDLCPLRLVRTAELRPSRRACRHGQADHWKPPASLHDFLFFAHLRAVSSRPLPYIISPITRRNKLSLTELTHRVILTSLTEHRRSISPVAEGEAAMNTTMQANELFSQMTGRAVEAFSVFAEANQKIMRDLVDLSASTAKEGVRLYAELSSSAVEALKDSQSYLLRPQGELQDAPRDPLSVYQKGVLDSVEGAQKAFKILESNAQAMTRSAERLQVTAEQTGKDIQATFAQVASKVKSLSSPIA